MHICNISFASFIPRPYDLFAGNTAEMGYLLTTLRGISLVTIGTKHNSLIIKNYYLIR